MISSYNLEPPKLDEFLANLRAAIGELLTETLLADATQSLALPEARSTWQIEDMEMVATYLCAQGGLAAVLSNGFKIRCVSYRNLCEVEPDDG